MRDTWCLLKLSGERAACLSQGPLWWREQLPEPGPSLLGRIDYPPRTISLPGVNLKNGGRTTEYGDLHQRLKCPRQI